MLDTMVTVHISPLECDVVSVYVCTHNGGGESLDHPQLVGHNHLCRVHPLSVRGAWGLISL